MQYDHELFDLDVSQSRRIVDVPLRSSTTVSVFDYGPAHVRERLDAHMAGLM